MTNARRKGTADERDFAQAILDTYQVKLHRRLERVHSGGHDLSVDLDGVGPVAQWLSAHAIEVKRYRADRQPWVIVLGLNELVPSTGSTFSAFLECIEELAGVS